VRALGVRLRTMPGDQASGSGGAERADMALSPEATGCSQGRNNVGALAALSPDYEVRSHACRPVALGRAVCLSSHRLAGAGEFQVEVADTRPGCA